MSTNIQNKPTVLVLSCLGGASHETAREAIEASLNDRFTFHVYYPFKDLVLSQFFDIENAYNTAAAWGFSKTLNFLQRFINTFIGSPCETKVQKVFKRLLDTHKPKCVVSLVPVLNKFFIPICQERKISYCLMPVYDDPDHWFTGLEEIKSFSPNTTLTYFHSGESKKILLDKGVPCSNIQGLKRPIHPKFLKKMPDKKTLCKELKLPYKRHSILITYGGAGSTRTQKIVALLAQQSFKKRIHLIILAGKNNRLKKRYEDLCNRLNLSATVLGFTQKIDQYMRASKILIGKPGPGIIFESLTIYRQRQKPFLLLDTGGILSWEERHVEMTENIGIGKAFMDTTFIEVFQTALKKTNPPLKESSPIKNPIEDLATIFNKTA